MERWHIQKSAFFQMIAERGTLAQEAVAREMFFLSPSTSTLADTYSSTEGTLEAARLRMDSLCHGQHQFAKIARLFKHGICSTLQHFLSIHQIQRST